MNNWSTSVLCEIAEITTGKLDSNAADEKGYYPFFTCAPKPLKINEYAFDCNAILLAGNNANGVFHINRFNGKFNAYQRTYIITAKANVDIDYLYYRLKTLLQSLGSYSLGTATKFLTRRILEPLKIVCPPLPTQRAIASILGALDDKIELNRKMNETLEEMARSIFKSWFVDFDPVHAKAAGEKPFGMDAETAALFPKEFEDSSIGKIPQGWTWEKLSKLATFSNGKSSPDRLETGLYPVYGANGIIGYSDTYLIADNAIIIGRVGSYCGEVYYYPSECWITDNAMYARALDQNHTMYLLMTLLNHKLNTHRAGSGQPLLNQTILNSLYSVLPNDKILKIFDNQVKLLKLKVQSHFVQNAQLSATRDYLLPLLLNGSLSLKKTEKIVENLI